MSRFSKAAARNWAAIESKMADTATYYRLSGEEIPGVEVVVSAERIDFEVVYTMSIGKHAVSRPVRGDMIILSEGDYQGSYTITGIVEEDESAYTVVVE